MSLRAPGAPASDPNTAASFDGLDDEGRVPNRASLDVGDAFTLEGWIRRSSTAKTHALMLKGTGALQLVVMSQGSGNQVLLRKAGVATIARSAGGVGAGAYHHVAVTKNGPNSATIYSDCVADTVQMSPAQVVLNAASPLTFGSASSTRELRRVRTLRLGTSPGGGARALPPRPRPRAVTMVPCAGYELRSILSSRAVRRRISSARSASRGRWTSSSLIASGS